jgi:hypothetical protein
MVKLCIKMFGATHDIIICFANTGCEHENTLKFVHDCEKHFGWNIVWVEAVVNPEKGKGVRHKVVDYETASRYGEPFEAVIAKYGIPNNFSPHCTRDTKEAPITSYLRSVGWTKGSYDTAIGIRADEMDRMNLDKKKRFKYPLANAGWTKEDVKRECASWPFDLELEGEHYGNCVWCWKKSLRKLMTLAKESPEVFDFPMAMEAKHGMTNERTETPRTFFRENRSTVDILELAKTLNFDPYRDIDQTEMFSMASYDVFLDTGSACGESCEIGADA